MRITAKSVSATLTLLSIVLCVPALADPPAHAPAHGRRAKHMGHGGYEWELDYGVLSGRCNRQAVATVLGGVAGAVIGNRVADSDSRAVATIIGAAVGALVGNRIGRELDAADEACLGHVLELGKPGQIVSWANESTGVTYRVAPGAAYEQGGLPCRRFDLLSAAGSNRSTRHGIACQSARGVWHVAE